MYILNTASTTKLLFTHLVTTDSSLCRGLSVLPFDMQYCTYVTAHHYSMLKFFIIRKKKCSLHIAVLQLHKQKHSYQEKLTLVQVITEHSKGKGIL